MTPSYIQEWLKAIGPVTVALAVLIATCWFYRWQIRLAKQKLRHDLYEPRFAIYAAFRELLLAFIEKDDDEIMAAFRKASIARFEARFVLDDPKIDANLDALCKQATADVISNIMYFRAMKPHGTMGQVAHSPRYHELCPVHRSIIAMSGSSDKVAVG
jgi:hypothetical protein